MKQGKLIRRAVSAALAGCMMFTFSAPALAESTDALMQLSMTRRSAVSVLDAENGDTVDYGITITITGREVKVDSDNCNNILGFLKYDPDEQKLTLLKSNASAVNYLTIDAPNTDVVLESTEMIVSNNLLIENARSVKVSSTGNWAPVYGKVYIYCACPVTLEHTEAGANSGVAISGIEFAAPVSASDFVYYTSNAPDATPTDAGTGTIPARTKNYLRIVPKVSYTITADGATITVDGKAVNSAFAGEKVTVTAAGKENAEFTGWTAEGITLTKEQKANPTVTFTMPGNNVTLTPNYNVVQDYGLEVGSENTTPTRVTSKNCKDILNKGVLSYDPTTQTLKSNGKLPRSLQKINAPGKDINLDGKDQIAVAAKLIVVDAHNVTISSNKFAAIFARDDTSTIDCTGKVDIRSGGDVVVNGNLSINNLGDVDLYANGNSISNKALTITSGGNVTIESTDGRAAKNLTINKAENVTITISDDERAVSENTDITASGTVTLKNKAPGGHVGTVTFKQADGKKYVYYTSEAEDAKLIDPRIHPLPDTVESSYLRIEPRETYYSITVANGTAQVGDDTTGQITTAFEGETVTVKANAPTDEDAAKGVKFHHWKVEEGSASFALTDGKLGSKEEAGTAEISFDMPKGNVKLTAVYSIPASVLRSTVTVEGGTAKSTLGEGGDIPAEIGTTVEITATPYDAEKYPGMEFVEWEIVYPDSFYQNFPDGIPENLQLKLDNAKSATTTFEMPVYPVKLIAHWSASPVAKPDPDEPIDEDFGVEPAPMDTTGGAIAAVAVGGAAIWGGYEIATRVILNGLLPEGAAIPANRGQLALLIWTEKGKPEPAAQPAFADVTDPDMAKAAQWCTEQGTMDAKGDRFEPEGWTPKFKVIEVWNKAFPKQ
ncbi:InlB B-repeat-containing protein [Faecalibacterium sp.]|uniref:InlB B-repeat-containing protein n=1 Tax=Faecalibacterium sp. TaxID=1971605 RepID=UPI0039953185